MGAANVGIGDEILVSGRARVMQQTDPRKVRLTYRGQVKPLHPVFRHNPRIAGMNENGDFQELQARDRKTNMRAYHTAKDSIKWTYNLDFRPDVGEIYLNPMEQEFGSRYPGRVIIEPHIKDGASPNKQWGFVRWEKIAWLLQPHGLRLAQVGPLGTKTLLGVDLIETGTFRLAAAVMAGARAVVLPEGGLSHLAAALGVPGVVIFGGYIAVETTGYAVHRNLGVSIGNACGYRIPCNHCKAEMAKITPEAVAKELLAVLNA